MIQAKKFFMDLKLLGDPMGDPIKVTCSRLELSVVSSAITVKKMCRNISEYLESHHLDYFILDLRACSYL